MAGDVNRYRIRGLLGRGGMAEVFEAQAIAGSGVTRRVAVKRLLSGHEADPDAARMFLDEARIASHLHHGAIVALLDYGVYEGQPFQVLELVDGLDAATLRRLGEAAGAPMPAEIALHLTAEVALALDYAHHVTNEGGQPLAVVHRDVKPSNILVSWNGDVKLGDFGIASALVRAERTLDGGIKGTPAYMGPEQLRGEALDGRADIFALGCTLCALLTGMSPLSRPDSAARLLRGEEIEPDPDIAPEEAALLATAVRARPEDRFATAGLFAEALGDLLARRIRKSPRSLLLEWLARVRPLATPRVSAPADGPEPRRAAHARFDALLGLDLEPDGSVPEARRFVTRTSEPRRETASPDLPSSESAPSRRWLHAGIAVTGLLLAVGVAALWPRTEMGLAAASAGAGVSGDVGAAGETAPPGGTSGGSLATALPVLGTGGAGQNGGGPPFSGDLPSVPSARVSSVSGAGSGSISGATVTATAAAGGAGSATATGMGPVGLPESGFLVIRGAGSVGAEIRVNGGSRGFAPKRVELPLGTYSVDLVLKDGRHLGPRGMSVTARHTRSSPLAWDVAAP